MAKTIAVRLGSLAALRASQVYASAIICAKRQPILLAVSL
jgi:hypothetical protein